MSGDLDEFKSKIQFLESTELREQDETKEDTYKNLLIYYLLNEEPLKAKFLWKRIPSSLKTNQSELVAIWSLVQLLIERKYPEAYDRVNQLQFSSKEMSDLVDLLIKKSKERLFDLINVAYSSISVKDMAQTFRITPEEAIKIAKSQGWHLDDSNTFLMPKKKQNKDIVGIPNQLQMEQLTKIVSFIET